MNTKTCQWREDTEGRWDTECGQCFDFNDGGPKENKALWCQYCGGELIPVPFSENSAEIPILEPVMTSRPFGPPNDQA
jgi:hypothetical protein